MSETPTTKVAGLILAAGASSRLGRAKQLLAYQGETLLDRTVGFFTALPLSDFCLVYGARRTELQPLLEEVPIRTVYNPDWSSGMGSSLRRGLQALLAAQPELGAVLIGLVDQPLVHAEHLSGLIALHRQHPQAIIAASYDDTLGVPVLFPRTFFGELLTQKGQAGAKKIIKKYTGQVIPFYCPEAAFDIDTPEDYQRLLSR